MSSIFDAMVNAGKEDSASSKNTAYEEPARERYKRTTVSLSDIIPNPDNMYAVVKDDAYYELLSNIRTEGFDPSQALKVKPKNADGKYMLISGERRWTAATEANLDKVPVVIDKDASGFSEVTEKVSILKANKGYRDKNIYNDVSQVKSIIESLKKEKKTQAEIKQSLMENLDKPQRTVEHYIKLSSLPETFIDLGKKEGILSGNDGLEILRAIDAGKDTDALYHTLLSIVSEDSKEDAKIRAKLAIEAFCKEKKEPQKKEAKSEDAIRYATRIKKCIEKTNLESLYVLQSDKRKVQFAGLLKEIKAQIAELENWFENN